MQHSSISGRNRYKHTSTGESWIMDRGSWMGAPGSGRGGVAVRRVGGYRRLVQWDGWMEWRRDSRASVQWEESSKRKTNEKGKKAKHESDKKTLGPNPAQGAGAGSSGYSATHSSCPAPPVLRRRGTARRGFTSSPLSSPSSIPPLSISPPPPPPPYPPPPPPPPPPLSLEIEGG